MKRGELPGSVLERRAIVYDVKAKTSGAIAYATGAAGAVPGLPKDLKKLLDTEYAGNKIT